MSMPHAETLTLLERLVACPTVSAESNLELIALAEAHLAAAGFATRRLPSADGRKAGLAAHLGGTRGGILLSAHSDVVPVAGQDWTRPPFALTRAEGRLYGRGTTDMKGFLAAALSLAGRAGRSTPKLPLMLLISYDEEVGCTGIRDMGPGIRALGWQPDLCIVGEPTGMAPAIGHKGKAAFTALCRSTPGHSSVAPRHVNSLHLATDLIAALRRMQDDYATGPHQDAGYDIAFSTVHVGTLSGGTALNIVPDRAQLSFEFRHLPADAPADFLTRLQAEVQDILDRCRDRDPAAGIELAVTNTYPGLQIAADHPAVAEVAGLAGNAPPIKVSYGTEAGYLSQYGFPTVVCGPGDMNGQGHKADEYLTLQQLAACDRMMDRILARLNA
ncbi:MULTISPECIES: acetylornithine deacetylase [unclassified Paracoccus (in: a-proteobacteria)]|uniref:acetylornithine deacetylase n=1 Tax=unclassified Paracoccus (in: a-proteobacteria) TaxID=2688777 RepID=UPI0012B3461C|nr:MULTISPECIES: acetylornithine deacetylase [unclassified Paracoccus (in: a-proteobacteria)]UXU76659.1 acetylornithine deacetylase [Paracoccus sp. SMMA_5]UXU82549.1 acetylornithine deacetylase [Paracoccus sp. SMMA_5_TC]